MELASDREDDVSLAALGIEACRLVVAGELASLHEVFGYAIAFGRVPVEAIGKDLARALVDLDATSFAAECRAVVQVRRCEPCGAGVLATIECLLPTSNGRALMVELVVTTSGATRHVTLEQFSAWG